MQIQEGPTPLQAACKALNATQRLSGNFSLKNVCVRFRSNSSSQAEIVSRDGVCTDIFGFSEFRMGFGYLLRVIPAGQRFGGQSIDACEKRRLALGVRYSNDNIYHQLFFAAANREALASRTEADAAFVPLSASSPRARPSTSSRSSPPSMGTRAIWRASPCPTRRARCGTWS